MVKVLKVRRLVDSFESLPFLSLPFRAVVSLRKGLQLLLTFRTTTKTIDLKSL